MVIATEHREGRMSAERLGDNMRTTWINKMWDTEINTKIFKKIK